MPATVHAFNKNRLDEGRLIDPNDEPPSGAELDPRIREVLIRLPREKAREDFTAVVLLRAGAATRTGRRLRSLAAAAAFCAFGALGAHEWNQNQTHQADAERLASLQLEYRMLQREIAELERAAEAQRPVVYLGSQGDVEYVIDLSRLPPRRGSAPAAARRDLRPASTSSL